MCYLLPSGPHMGTWESRRKDKASDRLIWRRDPQFLRTQLEATLITRDALSHLMLTSTLLISVTHVQIPDLSG